MSWIYTVPYEKAEGKLRRLYDRIKGPDENVDNIMLAHSLRPHTMEGHMALYKSVLHHSANEVPKWFLETIGVYVSQLNQCAYCVEHHFGGLNRLLQDESRSAAIAAALEGEQFEGTFSEKEAIALGYVRALTLAPRTLAKANIADLAKAGWKDGDILEINQVVAYFNYANRTVLGLGVLIEGDIVGLSPGDADDPGNWQHG